MKGGILKDGRLYIDRAGHPKPCDCRFAIAVTHVKVEGKNVALEPHEAARVYRQGYGCSDHCAHMQEPRKLNNGQVEVKLCHGTFLIFDEFKDQRVTPSLVEKNNG